MIEMPTVAALALEAEVKGSLRLAHGHLACRRPADGLHQVAAARVALRKLELVYLEAQRDLDESTP